MMPARLRWSTARAALASQTCSAGRVVAREEWQDPDESQQRQFARDKEDQNTEMKPRWLLHRGRGVEGRWGLAVWDNEQRPGQDETGATTRRIARLGPTSAFFFVGRKRRRTEIGDGSDGTK